MARRFHFFFHSLASFALIFGLLSASSAWAGSYTVDQVPNPRGAQAHGGSHVADPDDILGVEARQGIEQLLADLERDTGVQVGVVAVEAIEPSDIFDFAQRLFVSWGMGDKARDNGLLVLLVKGQRTVRFHTGYGLEGDLPDLLCQRIQGQFMVPEFKQGRYGEGMLAGLTEIHRVLSQSSQTSALSALMARDDPGEEPSSWVVFKFVLGTGGTLSVLLVFALKWMLGHFSNDGVRPTELRRAYTRTSWLVAFLLVPALVVVAWNGMLPRSPVLTCAVTLYAYFMLLTVRQALHAKRHMARLSEKKQYFLIVKRLKEQQGFWGWVALAFPLPFLPCYFYLRSRQTRFRNHPRQCTKCGEAARRLSESEEDAFLSAAHQKEEALRSADHDVWQCVACSATVLRSYPGTETKYEKCPDCKCLAYEQESDKVLVSPSYSTSGKGERKHVCHFCGVHKTKTYSIARLTASNGESSSGGGSSSSSSWGGGSSGGGGASSSW
jgi:uncharacterized protein